MKKLFFMVMLFAAVVATVNVQAGSVNGGYGACLMRCQSQNRSKSVTGVVINCQATCKANPNAFARYL